MSGKGEAYILIISDGRDNCGIGDVGADDATPQMLGDVTAELLESMGIKTVVIGFGADVEPYQLNAMAAAGGTAFTEFLDAADGDELNAAMADIAENVVIPCSYEVGEYDPEKVNLNLVNVRFDGEPIPRDDGCAAHTGWRWTDETKSVISFCEEACNTLKSGSVEQVDGEIACRPEDVIIVI